MTHEQPNNRPIHPECPHIDHADAHCQCDLLWGDMQDYASFSEARRVFTRLENRRRTKITPGWLADLDELDETEELLEESEPVTLDAMDDLSRAGFWRESERLLDAHNSMFKKPMDTKDQ